MSDSSTLRDSIFKALAGVAAAVAVTMPSIMMVMDRAAEKQRSLQIEEDRLRQDALHNEQRKLQQEQEGRRLRATEQQVALEIWRERGPICKEAVRLGVVLAGDGRAPRSVWESWSALRSGPMELVADPRTIAAAAALEQAAACTRDCPDGGRRQALVELRRACAALTPWAASIPPIAALSPDPAEAPRAAD